MRTISHVVSEVACAQSAATFGLMGNGNAYFLDGLTRAEHHFVAVRHETAAVTAADTFYRVSGSIATATVTYGAGFTNMLTALAEARMARTPLVVVVGDQPTTGARPWDINQVDAAAALGVETLTVTATTARATADLAYRRARELRTPVIVAIPYDLASVPAPDTTQAKSAYAETPQTKTLPARALAHREPSGSTLARVAGLLTSAERPLVVAGQGAKHAHELVTELANRLDALTATTALGKGTFGDRAGDLGVCGGFAAEEPARLIQSADVVLVVGAGLNQFTTAFGHAFGEKATIIQIDDSSAPTNPRVDVFLQADAEVACRQLLLELPSLKHDEWMRAGSRADGHVAGDTVASDGLLDPRSLAQSLDELLPSDRVFVQDGGHFLGWMPMYARVEKPGSFHMVGTAFQSIGLGLASAVGAVSALGLTEPGRTTVLATGDGGFLMALADLESVVRVSVNSKTVIVIFNDGCYGAEVHQYASRGVNDAAMQTGAVDFATVARGMGAIGLTLNTLSDLSTLRAWCESDARGTFVIDARISPTVVAPYIEEITRVMAATESRFAEMATSPSGTTVQN